VDGGVEGGDDGSPGDASASAEGSVGNGPADASAIGLEADAEASAADSSFDDAATQYDATSSNTPDSSIDGSTDDAEGQEGGAIPFDAGLPDSGDASSSPPPIPLAFVDVTIGPASSGSCSQAGWQLVLAGSAPGIGQVVVRAPTSALTSTSCNVGIGDAGLFDFQANSDHSPQPDGQGAMEIWGAQVDAAGFASGVSVYFDLGKNVYTEGDCTITTSFEITQGASPPPPSVARGRIYGHLSCPNASGVLPDLCDIEADFVYENCTEK
jgi:hypothetical protein